MRRKRGPEALCAQPFGWRTLIEVLVVLLLSETGVKKARSPTLSPAWSRLAGGIFLENRFRAQGERDQGPGPSLDKERWSRLG